jgi:hypothetical protein
MTSHFSRSCIYVLGRFKTNGDALIRLGSGVLVTRVDKRLKDGWSPLFAFSPKVDRDLLYRVEYSLHWLLGLIPSVQRDGQKEEFWGDRSTLINSIAYFGGKTQASVYRCIDSDSGDHVYFNDIEDAFNNRDGGGVYAKTMDPRSLAENLILLFVLIRSKEISPCKRPDDYTADELKYFLNTLILLGIKKGELPRSLVKKYESMLYCADDDPF